MSAVTPFLSKHNSIYSFLLSIGVALLALAAPAQAAWEPTFVDNFNGNSLDERSWIYGRQILPRRLQYYDRDAVSVRNGILRLGVLNRPESDRPYTAGAITSQGLFRQRYGHFEMRAKMPKGNGFWPAFWLMPEDGRWSSEIDISEFFGDKPNSVHNAFHYDFRLQNANSSTTEVPIDLTESFNTYAVQWSPNRIDYLLNGRVTHSITERARVAKARSQMYVILNVALASQHLGFIPTVDRQTALTEAMEVDYVRVYRSDSRGRYANIPGPNANVPNKRPAAYDNTALSVDRIKGRNEVDIVRQPGRVTGSLRVTAHKDNYRGQISVVLLKLNDFDPGNGRYNKTASLDFQKFDINLGAAGNSRVINYALGPRINGVGAYVVDVVVNDFNARTKRNLGSHRIVQFVHNSEPNRTIFFDGFFRPGAARYENGRVRATLQLQLQQSLLSAHLKAQYEVVDTETGESIATLNQQHAHTDVGLQTLEPTINIPAAASRRPLGLIVNVTDSSGVFVLDQYSVPISNTAQVSADWDPNLQNVGVVQELQGERIPNQRWQPTFVDNFDANSLNPARWAPGRSILERRISYYDKDALVLNDGKLDIKILNRAESDRGYTTGAITTQGIFKQRYGYFEMRARIPNGDGFWPAFWLMPEDGLWSSEIDIAELRGNATNTTHHAFHYGNRLRNEHSSTEQIPFDLSRSYNNYAVHWTPTRIDYLLNGVILHSITNRNAVANARSDMYMILNLALSSQHSGWIPTVNSETSLARDFSIDYVRVFSSNPNGAYNGIPAADQYVPDVEPRAYDNTALSVDRLNPGTSDLLRSGNTINGQFEVTSHKANYSGSVEITLKKLERINSSNGRIERATALATRKLPVNIGNIGGKRTLNYSFPINGNQSAAYSVDVVIKDNRKPNKKILTMMRVVQRVHTNRPDTSVFFQGFNRSLSASYSGGQVRSSLQLQLQQSMLVPYINAQYQLVDLSNNKVVGTQTHRIEHKGPGLLKLDRSIRVGLNGGRNYQLRVRISDSSGRYSLPVITQNFSR